MSTQLFSLPPSAMGFHASTRDSIQTGSVRAKQLEIETAITDSLTDSNGNKLVNSEAITFARSVTQPTPGEGKGRLWVSNATTPYPLMFTNDEGTSIELPPSLASALVSSTDADNQRISNLASLQNENGAGVNLGTDAAGAGIAIGQQASAVASTQIVVGAGSSTASAQGVVVGADSAMAALTNPGGVCVGVGNASKGRAIVVGNGIVEAGDSDGALGANIAIGAGVSIAGATTTGAIVLGAGAAAQANGSVVVGKGASGNNLATNSVAIGKGASVEEALCVAIGENASAASTGGVAIGRESAVTSGAQASAVGFQAAASSLAIGAHASSTALKSVALGGGTQPGDGASASGSQGIAVGNDTAATHTSSIVLGAGVASRAANETAWRGVRVLRGTVQTTSGAPTTALDFPMQLGDVCAVDVTVLGRSNEDKTYLASFRRQHFRFKSSGLSKAGGIGDSLQDNSETINFSSTVTAADGNVRVTVSGAAGKTVDWIVVMQVYCAPLV